MSTVLFGNVKVGATSLSLPILLLKADNTPDTGKVAADLTAYYHRYGDPSTTPISLSDLANLNSSYSMGGIKEIGDGEYRLDHPNAMWVTGTNIVTVTVKDGTTSLFKQQFMLEPHGADDVYTLIGAAGAGLTALGDSRIANLDATVSSRGTSTYAGGAVASVTGNVGGNVTGSVGSVSGAVGSVTAGVTVATNSDKTGYSLASTGLDAIPITDPGGVSGQTTFPKILVALYRRFFKKSTMTSSQLITYANDGTTPNTTQALSDDGTTQTQGAAT